MPDAGLTDGVTEYDAAFHDTYVRQQVVAQVTSSTRPTNILGRLIAQDTGEVLLGTGSGNNWIVMAEPAQSFTPAWGGITEGNATNTGYYRRHDGFIDVVASIVFAADTSVTGTVSLTLPKTMYSSQQFSADVRFLDASAGYYPGWAVPVSTTALAIFAPTASGSYVSGGALSSTVPFTWTTTDGIFVMTTYRMANRYD